MVWDYRGGILEEGGLTVRSHDQIIPSASTGGKANRPTISPVTKLVSQDSNHLVTRTRFNGLLRKNL